MTSRRDFVRAALALSGLSMASRFGRFGLLNAAAPASGPYRALVCVFLYGGNDSNNMVIDYTSYDKYYKPTRANLALDRTTLLPFDGPLASARFGLHPRFKEIQAIATNVAIVGNVGPLAAPITDRTQFIKNTVALPGNLFSHADQQAEWQTSISTGVATTGWAGRAADQVAHMNTGTFPTYVSVAGNAIFGAAAVTHPGSVTPGAPVGLQGYGADPASQARLAALEALAGQQAVHTDSGAVLVRAAQTNMQNALKDADTLNAALKSATPISTVFPQTNLGQQMLEVAKLIQVRDKLGMNRQIFFCSLGGFDTHTNQLADQDRLFATLSPALEAFYKATGELKVASEVTTFTESDFSRTLQPNSNGGTDHAWGSHHLVIGGSVKGAKMYGEFPSLQLQGPNDAGGEGRWIPTTSVDEYGAALAEWFGVLPANISTVFPNLANVIKPATAPDLALFA